MKNAELYPEGRTLFYEGKYPAAFVKEMKAEYGLEPIIMVHVPAELLDEIKNAHNMGS